VTLRDFSLLADENIHPDVSKFLCDEGFDVWQVRERGPRGADDSELIALSLEQRRVVLTHDRDFGKLVVAGFQPFVGILYLRPGHHAPEFTITSLRAVWDADLDLSPPFILVAQRTDEMIVIRRRAYPKTPAE